MLRKPATSVVVLRWPCGKHIRRRSPFLQRPCIRAMFVAVQLIIEPALALLQEVGTALLYRMASLFCESSRAGQETGARPPC